MRLRTLLALSTCVIVVPALAGLSLATFWLAESRIYGSVDSALEGRALSIQSSVKPASGSLGPAEIAVSRASLDRQLAQGGTFRIYDTDGKVLYPTASLGTAIGTTPSQALGFSTMVRDGERLRTLRREYIAIGRTIGFVEVSESLVAADGATRDIKQFLIVGSSLTAIAMIGACYFLASRLTNSLLRISEHTRTVQATVDFSKPIPATAAPREVHDLRTAFNALLERIQEMVSAQRAFFADTSHELRRPLTVLRTNIDILRMPGLDDTRRPGLYDDMAIEAAAMSRLLADLLVLSRGESALIESTPVNLSQVVERSLSRLAEYCDEHRVERNIEDDLLVLGNEDAFAHIVDNLLENAHLYTPRGGSIHVELASRGPNGVLEIRDTGVGMTEAEVTSAFGRFFRGTEARRTRPEGTGLGLAIVQHLVESHAGKVTLISKPGSGTTCRVSLPRGGEQAPP